MNKKKGIIIGAAAAAVLTAVVLLLVFLPKGSGDNQAATIDEGIDMIRHIDKDGMHQVEIVTDKDGNIKNNSYGTLMEYYPANISTIHIENAKGTLDVISNTPEGEATVYTIKGYEDFDLQKGNPDLIANAAASLSFTKVATMDKNKGAEFGFDKPRSTVTVTYEDGSRAIIIVGSDAPQQAGTYIKFGTADTVYVADTQTVSVFDDGLTDLISLTVNDAADNDENNQASTIKLAGSAFSKEIELVPNTDENYFATFRMTSPDERLANESESSIVAGGIRGLLAKSVKMVNPSAKQLAELGMDKPAATLTAEYPDTTVKLRAGKPDKDGDVLLMADGKNVVYVIAADKVPWCMTSFEKLCGEFACNPKMEKLTGMTVKAGGKTYDFALESRESVTTDDDGDESKTTVTTVTYGGKEVPLGDFTAFYDKVSLIKLADCKASAAGSGKEELAVTYTFADGGSDTVVFTASGDSYLAELNGKVMGHSNKGDVTRAVKGVAEVVK